MVVASTAAAPVAAVELAAEITSSKFQVEHQGACPHHKLLKTAWAEEGGLSNKSLYVGCP